MNGTLGKKPKMKTFRHTRRKGEMITMSKRNTKSCNCKASKKVDILKTPEGVCLNEKSFGKVHELKKGTSIFGVDEYVFCGKLHQGEVSFIGGTNLKDVYPSVADNNHGYTLEGNAQKIFKAENALVRHSDSEDRDFVYINEKSSLHFVGDSNKNYEIHVRIYDNCYGNDDNRWVVIYAD